MTASIGPRLAALAVLIASGCHHDPSPGNGLLPTTGSDAVAGSRFDSASSADVEQDAGAAAVVSTTPYYWTPPASMILDHFAQIGGAIKIPFYILYTPEELPANKITTEIVLDLLKRLENFAGVADASLDWQFMINIVSNAWRTRPDFQLISGTEYMVSAGTVGATSMFSSLAGVAPKLVAELYRICRTENYFDARKPQEDVADLRQAVKRAGAAGLKGALQAMGRDCGNPRPPLANLTASGRKKLTAELEALPALRDEPRGW